MRTIIPHYRFDATYHYREGERYNTGRGLSVISDDLSEVERVFATYESQGEPYALSITRLDTSEVLKCKGDMKAAERSGIRAYHARFRKET